MRSVLFNIGFYIWTFLFSIILQFTSISTELSLKASRLWAVGVIDYLAKYIAGINYIVSGTENIPPANTGFVVASKHQSAWETMYYFLPFPRAAFAYKKELAYIPLWGWVHYYNQNIKIDRQAGASALKSLLKQAKQRAAEGRPIIIFPEGTRTKPAQTGHSYHSSIYALYNQGLTVVPVALNSGVFWPKNSLKKLKGTLKVQYLPEMPKGLKKDEFMKELESRIESASLAML
jgi:1-acyl-sn-glycerol-3-phosphate acyltransferase